MEVSTHDFQTWKFGLRSVCGQFDARRSRVEDDFHGTVALRRFGNLEIARIEGNAASVARARRYIHRDSDLCFLVLQMAGRQHLCCDGLEPEEMRPGDVMLLDPATPFEMLPHGTVENLSVHLPRALVAEKFSGRTFGGKLKTGVASVRMLAALMNQLAGTGEDYKITNAEAALVRTSLVNFLLPSLRREDDHDRLKDVNDEVYRLALRHVEAHLESSLLNATWLAERLRISRRQLYRAFEIHGHAGIAQFILARRLERAALLLRDGKRAEQAIGFIAMESGFRDLAHFSRIFRRRYDMTPTKYRQTFLVGVESSTND